MFLQFVLKTAPSGLVTSRHVSGGTILQRPLSSGIQEFGTQKENWPLSEPIIKLEALAQTSGMYQAQNNIKTSLFTNKNRSGSVLRLYKSCFVLS